MTCCATQHWPETITPDTRHEIGSGVDYRCCHVATAPETLLSKHFIIAPHAVLCACIAHERKVRMRRCDSVKKSNDFGRMLAYGWIIPASKMFAHQSAFRLFRRSSTSYHCILRPTRGANASRFNRAMCIEFSDHRVAVLVFLNKLLQLWSKGHWTPALFCSQAVLTGRRYRLSRWVSFWTPMHLDGPFDAGDTHTGEAKFCYCIRLQGVSLGPPESSTQTASRSLQPFLQTSLGDRPTDRPRYSVGNNRRSAQWRSQILLLSTATTSIYWSSGLDRSDQRQQSAAIFSCKTRRVAVYVETHCNIASNRAFPIGVPDRWRNMFTYLLTQKLFSSCIRHSTIPSVTCLPLSDASVSDVLLIVSVSNSVCFSAHCPVSRYFIGWPGRDLIT